MNSPSEVLPASERDYARVRLAIKFAIPMRIRGADGEYLRWTCAVCRDEVEGFERPAHGVCIACAAEYEPARRDLRPAVPIAELAALPAPKPAPVLAIEEKPVEQPPHPWSREAAVDLTRGAARRKRPDPAQISLF